MGKLSTSDAIQKCINIHGNTFDYSKFEFIKSTEKVTIICKKHGEFKQRFHDHIKGCGCPKCSGLNKLNSVEFIKRANIIHKKTYDYSEAIYYGYETKVKIICKEHGEFEQTPHSHLVGKGCDKCGVEKYSKTHINNHEYFLTKANTIHKDKYEYISKYEKQNKKIDIVCPIHGLFNQIAKYHLSGNGCPSCVESKGENEIKCFLINNNINFIRQHKFKDCKHINQLPFDFYLPDFNICIEYDGRHHYIPIKRWGGETELKNTQKRDEIKTKYCHKNNIKLIRIKYIVKMKDIKEKILVELRASEGGEDSKLLVGEMKNIYIKTAKINNLD